MAWREESIVSQRLEFVTLASAEGANIRELCRRYRISAPTGYKWLERHRVGGELALLDSSRRPRPVALPCTVPLPWPALRPR
jgi:transposase